MSDKRKSTQYILPLNKATNNEGYDIYPAFNLGDNAIFDGFNSLALKLYNHRNVIIDGYIGVDFDNFTSRLNEELLSLGVSATWWSIDSALKSPEEIEDLVAPYCGGQDPLFGFRTQLELTDYYSSSKIKKIIPDSEAKMNILVGIGASLVGWDGILIYLDVPKNELQFRSRAGSVHNLGLSKPLSPKEMYKRFYFVDWIVLNKHKKNLIADIDIFVDEQRTTEITWAEGDTIRRGLSEMSKNAFRVRPWFEPGAWGGQKLKEVVPQLPQNVQNYAWSFELIVPENGLLFCSESKLLELSFDTLMYYKGSSVVGEECYSIYGDEFPLRLDYLDNFDGGNLSIQCHPKLDYIQSNFGELLTQEETYYILDCKENAKVYLGFNDDINPSDFESALYESYNSASPLDVSRYIHSEQSKKHSLYLIPPGTLHSSGRNNLVLEISTTPYIFTFKMYDWLSLDLDGCPRPLNIQRAMDNLCFDRKGEVIPNEHIAHPKIVEKESGWELWHLPTHHEHSYDVYRYVINAEQDVLVRTNGKFNALNLVEGSNATIITKNNMRYNISYAESLVISADADSYRIINPTSTPIMLVQAFMK